MTGISGNDINDLSPTYPPRRGGELRKVISVRSSATAPALSCFRPHALT
jgi:hypothetical protein